MEELIVQKKQRISIIICTYTQDRWEELSASINSARCQTLPPEEIIVVVDHNPNLLQTLLKSFTDILVIENVGPRGLSGARNCGIAATKGELLAFLDDDAVAAPDWLFQLSQQLLQSHVLGVGGAIEPAWQKGKPAWFPEEFYWVVGCTYRGLPQSVQEIRNPIGANMCLRREIFAAIGGFSSEIGRVGIRPIGCEETELCIRARQRWSQKVFLYQPEARVSHFVPASRSSWRYFNARCYAEGLSKAVVARLAGAEAGLSSERTYTLKTLPLGVLHGMRDGFFRLDIAGFLRAGVIVTGLFMTATGYCVGSVARSTITKTHTEIATVAHAEHTEEAVGQAGR